jgi:tRNA dimethylallyltransferase
MQKTVRALEVCLLARAPISKMQASGRSGLEGYGVVKLGLNPERKQLCERINRRVERMFATGLLEETRALLARQDARRIKALGALGYRQACAVLEGRMSLPAGVVETQSATRRYSKRQMTWFRHEAGIIWFGGFGEDPAIQSQVINLLYRLGIAVQKGSPASKNPAFRLHIPNQDEG